MDGREEAGLNPAEVKNGVPLRSWQPLAAILPLGGILTEPYEWSSGISGSFCYGASVLGWTVTVPVPKSSQR